MIEFSTLNGNKLHFWAICPCSYVNSTNPQYNDHPALVSCPEKQHFSAKMHFFTRKKLNREKIHEKYRMRPNGRISFLTNRITPTLLRKSILTCSTVTEFEPQLFPPNLFRRNDQNAILRYIREWKLSHLLQCYLPILVVAHNNGIGCSP